MHGRAGLRPAGFRGRWRDDEEARAVYAEAAGIVREMPAAVAVPQDADDVVTLVRWAASTGAPLVPRGSGSSMGGGAVGAGVVVDLSRLDAIGPVDAAACRVTVGPGALRNRVDELARAHGLRFPVDPSSGAFCTVGGMAAVNAAGPRSLRWGATRPWVQALDCVFADGSRATVRRGKPVPAQVPALARLERLREALARQAGDPALQALPGVRKDTSGYALASWLAGDVVDLLVGSEGTLALFVGVQLRLAPLPTTTSSLLAAFPSLEQSVRAASAARALGASACELLEGTFLDIAREGGTPLPVPPGTEAVLLVEIEADSPQLAGDGARQAARAFRGAGASQVTIALDHRTAERIWDMRHRASPTLARLFPGIASMQFIEDGAVPPHRLPAYVRGVRAALERQGIRGVIFGHAGDAHVHVNPLVDVHAPGWRPKVEAILDEVTALTATLGGTLAGEHGDGRLRTPLLERTRGAGRAAAYRRVKEAADPAGILNPGVKVPVPGQRPLGDIKYDPALAPLPPAARRALDQVSAGRRYATCRLDLLDEERRRS